MRVKDPYKAQEQMQVQELKLTLGLLYSSWGLRYWQISLPALMVKISIILNSPQPEEQVVRGKGVGGVMSPLKRRPPSQTQCSALSTQVALVGSC